MLTPITEADHADVLALNQANVELLSPLDDEGLRELKAWAEHYDTIRHDGGFAGFVVTMRDGTAYDSDNYVWFGERYPSFTYLDRVVLAPHVRRLGLATRVYDRLEAEASGYAPVFALEVNVDPPNEPSLAFHAARGFVEVGQRGEPGHLVSLLVKDLTI